MIAKLTLIGIYKYYNETGRDLFEGLNFPEGIEKTNVINKILLDGGEFPLIYDNPDFIHDFINSWCSIHYRTFEKWITALNIQYDPLYNYDKTEIRSGSASKSGTLEGTKNTSDNYTHNSVIQNGHTDLHSITDGGSDTETKSLSGTGTNTTANTETHDVSAYNSTADYEKDNKTTQNGSVNTTSTVTENNSYTHGKTVRDEYTGNGNGSDSLTHHGTIDETTNNTTSESATNDETVTVKGNIGVTTSQQMLKDELNIAKWNIYENIATMFINDFCTPIYI